jgi:CheY-like chemotaxis protein
MKPLCEERGNRLSIQVGEEVPASVIGDFGRILQILLNLVGNAAKFTENGSIEVTIDNRLLKPYSSRIQFRITDTGIGIPYSKQESIFCEYVQASSDTAERFGGTGLGLAISRQLIQSMGGELQLRSEPGQGSEFWFEIPLKPSHDGINGENEISTELAIMNQKLLNGVRVLVAEDNEINWIVTESILLRMGAIACHAVHGREAVKLFQNQQFDLVLMDCQMPVMDGFQATYRIRAIEQGTGRSTPIIALTADIVGNTADKCEGAGMNGYIAKPFDVRDLTSKIELIAPDLITLAS